MIQIRTTLPLPEGEITTDHRHDVAKAFARFMPDYHVHRAVIPLAAGSDHGRYVFDSHGRWTCRVDAIDNHLVASIDYLSEKADSQKELDFARWVVQCRPGWQILEPEDQQGISASVSVEFNVWLPTRYTEEELSTITFGIPIAAVDVFVGDLLIPGAEVRGYVTQMDVEIQTPGDRA